MDYILFAFEKTFNFNKWVKTIQNVSVKSKHDHIFEFDSMIKSGYLKKEIYINSQKIELFDFYSPSLQQWFNLVGWMFGFEQAEKLVQYAYNTHQDEQQAIFLNIGLIKKDNDLQKKIESSFLSFDDKIQSNLNIQ